MGMQIILKSLVLVSKIAQFKSYAAGLLLVFSLFTKFGVERVNTFKVIGNNAKFPRNRETFGGWFDPYAKFVLT